MYDSDIDVGAMALAGGATAGYAANMFQDGTGGSADSALSAFGQARYAFYQQTGIALPETGDSFFLICLFAFVAVLATMILVVAVFRRRNNRLKYAPTPYMKRGQHARYHNDPPSERK